MALDSYRIRETKEKELEKIDSKKVASDIRSLKDLIDSLPTDMDEDIDIKWIKENETSEGKINFASSTPDNEDEEKVDLSNLEDVPWSSGEAEDEKINLSDLSDLPEIEEINEIKLSDLPDIEAVELKEKQVTDEISLSDLSDIKAEDTEASQTLSEFTSYVNSLIQKYNAYDYHRMMTQIEISKFADLYSKTYGIDRRDALALVEDSINKQLNSEKSENDIRRQGLEQEKLNVLTTEYRGKYGENFVAYLDDQELERYSNQYLHSYNVRRSDIDKQIESSLNNVYADAVIKGMENGTIGVDGNTIVNETTIQSSRTMGFSMLKLLLLVTGAFLASAVIIVLSLLLK